MSEPSLAEAISGFRVALRRLRLSLYVCGAISLAGIIALVLLDATR